MSKEPLWMCPKCRRRFTRSAQSHACGNYTVQNYLTRKPESIVKLYRQLERLILSMGGVEIAPAKTRIGFQYRRVFAAVNRIASRHLDIHIVTSHPIRDQRIYRIEKMAPECFVNHLRLQSPRDLNRELREWLRRGYGWGKASR